MEEKDKWQIRFERERRARKESEALLESKSLELWKINQNLEKQVNERTESLKKALIKAEKADRAKSDFLANMSHEIRTPLNAIIGFSNILCENNSLNIQGQKQAATIHSSANTLLSIINDILDISKIENGNFDISEEPVDLPHICEHVIELFSKKANEKNIKLIFNLDQKIQKCVLSDSVRIRQIISNLLSNAIKFTPSYGNVALSINTLETTNEEIKIRFEIEDTGIGIQKDKLDNIFEPFIQIDHKSNRQFQGTGLGLSICSHIVQLLNSTIQIESEIGKGTRFWFDVNFTICNEQINTNKQYLNNLNFLVSNTETNLFKYIKNYLNIFGTINDFNSNKNDIIIYSINKKNKEDLEVFRKTNVKPCIFLFEFEEDAENFVCKQNENVITLPFYPSKLHDTIQELKLKNNNEEILIKDSIIKNETIKNSFKANILVAEDNNANQELISYVLEELGVNYTIKDNGKEAYDEIQNNNNYDLILMDINMPLMDGVEALNHIRKYEILNNLKHIPIIALTANAIKGDKEKFLDLGMDDYLSKPINTNELKEIFNKFLQKNNTKKEKDFFEKIELDKVISKLGVSENIAQLVINRFEKEITNDLYELEKHIQNNDIENINSKAHYIKNSCLNVCLNNACELLQELENKNLENSKQIELFNRLKKLFLF